MKKCNFRVSVEDWELVHRASMSENLSMSEYVRGVVVEDARGLLERNGEESGGEDTGEDTEEIDLSGLHEDLRLVWEAGLVAGSEKAMSRLARKTVAEQSRLWGQVRSGLYGSFDLALGMEDTLGDTEDTSDA